jgi:Fe2+ or Zn2+ uptake regulation protein
MICSQCGKIEEFKSELVDKLAEELEKKYGFETKSIHIDFVGLCADCRNKI